MTPKPITDEILHEDMSPEERESFLKAVEEGLADADAGRLIPFEKVKKWLLSWGTDHELPPPE